MKTSPTGKKPNEPKKHKPETNESVLKKLRAELRQAGFTPRT